MPGGETLSKWLNREIRISRWILETNFETAFADGLLFAEILARFGVVDLRHFISSRREGEKADGAFNMSRLVKAMKRIKIVWIPERCAAIIEKVPDAARGVVRELFGRFGHLTLPPSAYQVREGSVEGGKVCICTVDYFADAPLRIGAQKKSAFHGESDDAATCSFRDSILNLLSAASRRKAASSRQLRSLAKQRRVEDEIFSALKRDATLGRALVRKSKRSNKKAKGKTRRSNEEALETRRAIDAFDWKIGATSVLTGSSDIAASESESRPVLTKDEDAVVKYLNEVVRNRRQAEFTVETATRRGEEEEEEDRGDAPEWSPRASSLTLSFVVDRELVDQWKALTGTASAVGGQTLAPPATAFAAAQAEGGGGGVLSLIIGEDFSGENSGGTAEGREGAKETRDGAADDDRDSLGRKPAIRYDDDDDTDDDDVCFGAVRKGEAEEAGGGGGRRTEANEGKTARFAERYAEEKDRQQQQQPMAEFKGRIRERPKDPDPAWMRDMKTRLKADYYHSEEFSRSYDEKLQKETEDWFRGKRQGVIIGLKSNRDAAAAFPEVSLREKQLQQLVEINRERFKEKLRIRAIRKEEVEEEEERRWALRRVEQRKEKREEERRRKEEKKFFDDLKESLWRERKAEREYRGKFETAFQKYPREDSSDEEVQLTWQHDNDPSKGLNVRWKCRAKTDVDNAQVDDSDCFHMPGVRLLEMERQAVRQEAALRRLDRKAVIGMRKLFSSLLNEEAEEEKEEMEIRRVDRTNHRIQELIRDMEPIPIRKTSYTNLKALIENEKEMEDQEERIQGEDRLRRLQRAEEELSTFAE